MNDDYAPPSVREVCEWKDRTAKETEGMTRSQVIEFYRSRADEMQRRLGLTLEGRPAAQVVLRASEPTAK